MKKSNRIIAGMITAITLLAIGAVLMIASSGKAEAWEIHQVDRSGANHFGILLHKENTAKDTITVACLQRPDYEALGDPPMLFSSVRLAPHNPLNVSPHQALGSASTSFPDGIWVANATGRMVSAVDDANSVSLAKWLDALQDRARLSINVGSGTVAFTNTITEHQVDAFRNACEALIAAKPMEPSSFPTATLTTEEEASHSSSTSGQYGDTPLIAAVRSNDVSTGRRIVATSGKAELCRRNSLGQTAWDLMQILERQDGFLDMLYASNAWDC